MIDPAKLNRSIIIERETTTLDRHRRPLKAWTKLASRRAELVTLSTEEFIAAYGENAKRTLVFRIRFLRDLTTKDRLTYEGAAFNIVDIQELGFREGLEIRAEAVE
ncbi:phage head closure protein [Aureimonas psammosilenae]|uniref:phage head closure protein n=1 Tax=Aureimonas psammosilenae TaxID=2495496 RepID=UPI001260AF79|nr:phage head closure protein [Aureimonas psammosilenae]